MKKDHFSQDYFHEMLFLRSLYSPDVERNVILTMFFRVVGMEMLMKISALMYISTGGIALVYSRLHRINIMNNGGQMMKKAVICLGFSVLLISQPVFSAEEETPVSTADTVDSSGAEGESLDSERLRLIQTLLGDSNDENDSSGDVMDGSGDVTDEGGEAADDSGDSDTEQPTQDQVTAFVKNLSEEQVSALNRSLNNAVNNGLPIEYNMEEMKLLEKIVEENYDGRQINALTKALEEDAKFRALAEKTGNDKFLERAEQQKEKFLSKIDRFRNDDMESQVTEELQDMAQDTVKSLSKETAKEAAREMAKNTAKENAKQAARDAVQESIKDVVKATKKETVKIQQAERKAAREAAKAEKVKPEKAEKAEKPEKPEKPEKVKPEKPEKAGKK